MLVTYSTLPSFLPPFVPIYRARLSLQDFLESEEQDVGTSPDHAGAAAAPSDTDDTICDNGTPPNPSPQSCLHSYPPIGGVHTCIVSCGVS